MENIQTHQLQSPRKIRRRKKEQHDQITHYKSIIWSNSNRRMSPAAVCSCLERSEFRQTSASVQFPTTASHILNYFYYTTLLSLQHQRCRLWPVNPTGGDYKQVHLFFLEDSFRKNPTELGNTKECEWKSQLGPSLVKTPKYTSLFSCSMCLKSTCVPSSIRFPAGGLPAGSRSELSATCLPHQLMVCKCRRDATKLPAAPNTGTLVEPAFVVAWC